MDRRTSSRAAEVPDVSPGLDIRVPQDLNSSKKHEGTTSSSDPEDVPSSELDNQKRRLSVPHILPELLNNSGPKRHRRASEPGNLFSAGSNDEQNETALRRTVPATMRKYFAQRHRLFHRYDEGIQLDEEAWYSVTPEKIAAHIATRYSHLKVVVDLYSCVGGNSIQFAKAGLRVIAVEIDEKKITMAKNNAMVYGVQGSIEFKKGDAFEVLSTLKDQFDSDWGIFLSPPWGGPSYVCQDVFDVSVFKDAVEKAMEISANVAILVPRNISINNVIKTFGRCEVEENYLGGKLKTITLYFGDLEGRGATIASIHEV